MFKEKNNFNLNWVNKFYKILLKYIINEKQWWRNLKKIYIIILLLLDDKIM